MAKREPNAEVMEALDNHPLGEGPTVVELSNQFVPETWEEVEAALAKAGADVMELKAVWAPTDKETLLGTAFLIVSYDFYDGDYGPFVAVRGMLKDNTRIVFVDGGTGIKEQLLHLAKTTGQKAGIKCPNGLRVSKYDYTDESTGESRPAKTYYIA